MAKQKYGVVYTPDTLSEFVAILLKRVVGDAPMSTVLDPASGECSLLNAAQGVFGERCEYIGIDVDKDAVNNTKDLFTIKFNDAILPRNVKRKTAEYWKDKLPTISAIIANPPWSSEKIYERSVLERAGYTLVAGQYDSYVLFIELAYSILCEQGVMAFIIPDSLFDAQNERLRKFLVEKTKIKVIARLGEKIFDEVNRATTVIICQKEVPSPEDETVCFRLSTDARKDYLTRKGTLISFFDESYHRVKQARFMQNKGYNFDIDAYSDEEELLAKITSEVIDWNHIFNFGRGVEISKAGKVVYCPICNYAQGYKKKQMVAGVKVCTHCGAEIPVNAETANNVVTHVPDSESVLIYVGENVHRYGINGEFYIRPNIEGINYKNRDLYTPPKLLVRKTGLGIYGAIDYTGSMTSQTVYILKYADEGNATPLEYYLALINSRVVYYYYLKVYGENEWKSHPYLTKQIIYTLPIRPYFGDELDQQIVHLATALMQKYDYQTDLRLEKLVMQKYGLSDEEERLISNEMKRLPNLSAVNNMKMEA